MYNGFEQRAMFGEATPSESN